MKRSTPASAVCLLAAFLALAVLSAPMIAQTPQTVIRTEVNLVHVLFSAFDRKGKHVAGLTTSDVEIYEDGTRQGIEFFRHQSDYESQAEPLAIVLLMDTSGSVKDKLGLEQAIALDFFKQVLRPQKDSAAIVQFDNRVGTVQDFTDDVEQLGKVLHSLRAVGSTALYEAVYMASDMASEEKLKMAPGRRVMVIVSDGEDTSSKVSRKDAIEAAQRNDVIIFAVGVNTQGFKSDFVSLKEFARETGGRFFNTRSNMREMSRVFQEMIEALKQHYNIFYYSTNQRKDGTFRAIHVRVKKKRVRVQHRVGYYAPRATGGNYARQ